MMNRERFSQAIRALSLLTVIGMVALVVYALLTQQPPAVPLSEAEVALTVDAGVAARLTEAAPTPNLNATIDARLTATALGTAPPSAAPTVTLTPIPTLTPQPPPPGGLQGMAENTGGILGLCLGIIGGLWNIIVAIWNFLSFGGIVLQALCCIGVPLLILVGILNESPFPG